MGNIDRIGRHIVILTPAGEVTNNLGTLFSLEWLSEAKLKARSEAKRHKSKFYFIRCEAVLRAISFATLSYFKQK
jgi:hypothetical protein